MAAAVQSQVGRGRVSPRALLALLALLLVVPLSGQNERLIHFRLQSYQTFLPGEKAAISLWAQGVPDLEFRVYRVRDPVVFFGKLEELHNFGGRAPQLTRKASFIEWLHDWKSDWAFAVRTFLRRQLSSSARQQIYAWLTPAPPPQKRVTSPSVARYAEAPVLNSEQLVATWQQPVTPSQNYWQSQNVEIPVNGKGVYLVEAVHGEKRAFTIVMVSEIAVLTKVWRGHALGFVVNRRTGNPVANFRAWIRKAKDTVVALKAGAEGLVDADIPSPGGGEMLLMARQDDDFAAAPLQSGYSRGFGDQALTGYVYTERPVYRPGHTVYFKGVLRQHNGLNYTLPSSKVFEVEIQDPDGKAVVRQTLNASAMGTVHSEYALPENAALGHYSVVMRPKGGTSPSAEANQDGEAEEGASWRYSSLSGDFEVEEYKKPEYEVRVTPATPRVLEGQNIQATIEARYYFGEPVAGAKVTYVTHRQVNWLPYYTPDDDESGEYASNDDTDYGGEETGEQQGALDAQGRLLITIPTQVSEKKFDYRYRIEARVTDAANREISGHGFALATYGSFYLQVSADKYLYATGETARLSVEARDYDGKPVAAAVRIDLLRWVYRANDKPVIASYQVRTDATGKGQADVKLPQGGSYVTQATSRTPEGRDIEASGYLWVSGAANWGGGASQQQLQIVPDKKTYQPGDVAKVLIVTGVPNAHVLVTAEGRQVYTRQVINAVESSVTIEVPIRPEYAPNVFVSAIFVQDNRLYRGVKRLKVPPVEHALNVELATSKPEYRPGDQGVYTVTARDNLGKPVSSAELSLGVVDEAIYAIRPDRVQDPLNFFYGRTSNEVGTQDSLTYYFNGEAGKRAITIAGGGGGGRARAQLKPEHLAQPRVRKDFRDTAIWVADLTTDASGRAVARLTFPDTLTTWRATSRGVTRDTKVGAAVLRTVVRKNLILRLAVPRFFTTGDEVTISAVVHNYLAGEKKAKVSLDVTGLEVLEGATREASIPSRGEVKLDWRVRAVPGAEAKLLGKALTDEESDAVELTLPVKAYGVKMSQGKAGAVSGAKGEADAQLDFPATATPDSRKLEISVSPSVAGALFGALEYLTAFPYGCTEQTMSSFLPNVVVAQALKDLQVQSNVNQAALDKKIRAGFERLYDYQHEDGGWGWWKTDESAAFMTAYVLYGFGQAQAAGYAVDAQRATRAQDWLRGEFKKQNRALPDLRAYLAFALVANGDGKADAATLEEVWAQRGDLTPYGAAMLGLAFEKLKDHRAAEMAEHLEKTVRQDEQEAYWQSNRDPLLEFDGDTSTEATAFAMKLLVRVRPQSPLLPKIALYLLSHRSEGFYWDTTKQTAMVIYGLTDYLKASGELRPNFSVEVTVNGKVALTRHFAASDALAISSPVIRLGPRELAAGRNIVHVRKDGPGVLYWSVVEQYYSTEEKLAAIGSVPLNLLREYFRLVREQSGERIVYSTAPLTGPVQSGDVVVVRLTVSGESWRYLLIEDPIPAGTEFIERDDLYEIKDKPGWWESYFTRREFHDDRAAFFETGFPRGQRQYVYLLKVVNPGRFRISPARVEPMYQPRYFATSDARVLEVK